MKIYLLSIFFLGCACQPIKDADKSPIEFNQKRLVFLDKNEVGIYGTNDSTETFTVDTIGKGTIQMRGFGLCGSVTNISSNGQTEIKLPKNDSLFCVYTIISKTNDYDAPSVGTLIVNNMKDPNITQLTTKIGNVTRSGVNWVQFVQPQNREISELKLITIYPSGKSGILNIVSNDCKFTQSLPYDQTPIEITILDDITTDCTYAVTANNDDTLKEFSIVHASVYKPFGAFLARPLVKETKKEMCFEFTDQYVTGIDVNNYRTTKKNICIPKSDLYRIIGVTSKMRTYFGIFDGKTWSEK